MTATVHGQKLVTLREICGLTQRELADLAGRSVHTIRSIEQGKHPLGEKLAAAISARAGVSMQWLLDDTQAGAPIDDAGEPLTRDRFESRVGGSLASLSLPRKIGMIWEQLVKEALHGHSTALAMYRVMKAIDEFEREFSPPGRPRAFTDLLPKYEKRIKREENAKAAGSKKKRP
jgi:transcriptional regulator with XRE-family HTH domain